MLSGPYTHRGATRVSIRRAHIYTHKHTHTHTHRGAMGESVVVVDAVTAVTLRSHTHTHTQTQTQTHTHTPHIQKHTHTQHVHLGPQVEVGDLEEFEDVDVAVEDNGEDGFPQFWADKEVDINGLFLLSLFHFFFCFFGCNLPISNVCLVFFTHTRTHAHTHETYKHSLSHT